MPMVWATQIQNDLAVHISEVPLGLRCACVCPGCRSPLEAVNSENPHWKRRPHFRHHSAPETLECELAGVITAVQAVLAKCPEFRLPDLIAQGVAQAKSGQVFRKELVEPGTVEAIREYAFVDVTDAVLTLASGEQVYVRLVAHGDSLSRLIAKQALLAEVVLDISDPALRSASWSELRQHVTFGSRKSYWCSHEMLPRLQARAQELVDQDAIAHDARMQRVAQDLAANQARTQLLASAHQPHHASSSKVQVLINLYRNGAYRLYAPVIDYDLILREAKQAVDGRRGLDDLLIEWALRYKMGDDMVPITRVLRAAGYRV